MSKRPVIEQNHSPTSPHQDITIKTDCHRFSEPLKAFTQEEPTCRPHIADETRYRTDRCLHRERVLLPNKRIQPDAQLERYDPLQLCHQASHIQCAAVIGDRVSRYRSCHEYTNTSKPSTATPLNANWESPLQNARYMILIRRFTATIYRFKHTPARPRALQAMSKPNPKSYPRSRIHTCIRTHNRTSIRSDGYQRKHKQRDDHGCKVPVLQIEAAQMRSAWSHDGDRGVETARTARTARTKDGESKWALSTLFFVKQSPPRSFEA